MEILENDTKTSEVLTSLLNNTEDKREGGKKEEKESKTSLTSQKKERKTSCRKIVVDIEQKLLDRIQSKRFVDYNDARLLIRIFCISNIKIYSIYGRQVWNISFIVHRDDFFRH